jgi:hypothetical protein
MVRFAKSSRVQVLGGAGGDTFSPAFSDDFNRANSAFLGPNWLPGPLLATGGGTGGGLGITAGVCVFQGSAVTAGDSTPFGAFPLPPAPAYAGSAIVNQFASLFLSLHGRTGGTAILAGPAIFGGCPLTTGDYRSYTLCWEAVDANPANDRWNLMQLVNTTRVSLGLGANGSAIAGQTLRLEGRATAASTILSIVVNGVTVTTITDASASRTSTGMPHINRSLWVGSGPINAINFGPFACGKL